MMSTESAVTIDVLNALYAAERRSLLPRLVEMGVFVSWAQAHEMDQVRRMVAEECRHQEWLQDAAEECRGALSPAGADVHAANLHYLDLLSLLPSVLASKNKLVATYARVIKESSGLTPKADETIARIYNRHQVHLEQLEQIIARLQNQGK